MSKNEIATLNASLNKEAEIGVKKTARLVAKTSINQRCICGNTQG